MTRREKRRKRWRRDSSRIKMEGREGKCGKRREKRGKERILEGGEETG